MTAQQVLDSLRRANPVCVICRGASGHPAIVGDGPPRCFHCIMRLTHLSAEPPMPPSRELPPWSA